MLSANGHGPKRAILYARVSTEEQARSGYSLAQQLEALREYATSEGYEILEEVLDPGQSGASLERPGMDRVRDLVATSGISVVLAQDRDRFAREPAYHYLLKKEFEEHGTKIRALNDKGDDSPEGQLTDGILDQLAKFERAKMAERTRRGKLRKAREGKIVATGRIPTYGFRYNQSRDSYLVDEQQMAVVRHIFRMIGTEAQGIHSVKRILEREGAPSPTGLRYWDRTAIRNMIRDDVYKPHTFEEVTALVSPEVAARLSPEKRYGIWWFNKRRTSVQQVAEDGLDGRSYRRRHKRALRPRKEWIAVPVPDAGVPRRWVESAREAIKDNRSLSSAGDRFWELSGGVLVCSVCGRRMLPDRRRNSRDSKRFYYYYRCKTRQHTGKDACKQWKSYRAKETEAAVWGFIADLLKDPDRLRTDLEKMIEEKRNGLVRGNPNWEAKAWAGKLAEVDRKRSGFQDMAAEGLITLDELRIKLAALEESRDTAQRELSALEARRELLAQLERDRDTLMEWYAGMASEALDSLSPKERHRVYKLLKLRVDMHLDGTLEVSGVLGKAPEVCNPESIY